jgi:hypothetical protein
LGGRSYLLESLFPYLLNLFSFFLGPGAKLLVEFF